MIDFTVIVQNENNTLTLKAKYYYEEFSLADEVRVVGFVAKTLAAQSQHDQIARIFVYDPQSQVDWDALLSDYTDRLILIRLPSPQLSSQSLVITERPLQLLVTIFDQELDTSITDESFWQTLEHHSGGMIAVNILRNPPRTTFVRELIQRDYHIWHYLGPQSTPTTLHFADTDLTVEQLRSTVAQQSSLVVATWHLWHEIRVTPDIFADCGIPVLIASRFPTHPSIGAEFFRAFYTSVFNEGIATAFHQAQQSTHLLSLGDSTHRDFAIFAQTNEDRLMVTADKPPLVPEVQRDQVFISYSHRDTPWCDMLLDYLNPLRQSHVIKAWVDKDIEPGSRWFDDIQQALARAKIAVLLASPAFFGSSFIQKYELPAILSSYQHGDCNIIWVAVSAYTYNLTVLKDIQAAHPPDHPLDRLSDTDAQDVLLKIVQLIAEALN